MVATYGTLVYGLTKYLKKCYCMKVKQIPELVLNSMSRLRTQTKSPLTQLIILNVLLATRFNNRFLNPDVKYQKFPVRFSIDFKKCFAYAFHKWNCGTRQFAKLYPANIPFNWTK